MAESATRHTRVWRQEATMRVFGLLILACVLVAAADRWIWPAAEQLLRYERAAVLQGQLWRLITAHLVHADGQHLAFNILGTVLIAALFPRTYGVRAWIAILAASALTIDAGFLVLEPGLEWYVGASGVLHGALAAGALGWWNTGQRLFGAILGSMLLAKIGWEHWHGALPLVSGIPVIVEAHAYGLVGGTVAGIGLSRR